MNAFLQLCVILFMFSATCINSLCFSQKQLVVLIIYVNTTCTPTIVEIKNKSQFDYQIGVEAQEYIYVEGNTTRAQLLVSQIRVLLTHGASQIAYLRRVCNNNITVAVEKLSYQL